MFIGEPAVNSNNYCTFKSNNKKYCFFAIQLSVNPAFGNGGIAFVR